MKGMDFGLQEPPRCPVQLTDKPRDPQTKKRN
jgi:hypothetical protein